MKHQSQKQSRTRQSRSPAPARPGRPEKRRTERKTSQSAVPGGLDTGEILELLRKVRHPLRLDDLLRMLDLSRRDKKALEASLYGLEAEGRLVRLPGGKWTDVGQARLVSGVLSVQRSGAGFVTPERTAGQGRVPQADIFVHPTFLGDAWHGDRVEVALLPGRRGPNPEGRILRVLERGSNELTVQIVRKGERGLIARPVDGRLDFRVEADVSGLPLPPAKGELLVVAPECRIGNSRGGELWRAKALRNLGREDDVDVQEQLVRINHQIPLEFPPNVLAEASGLEPQPGFAPEAPPRSVLPHTSSAELQDLRGLPFVTIDGEDARDFDDAVCVLEEEKGSSLWVAIADVSRYVRPGSALDREARERGNSYYFPASVTPMLPEILSNDLCSLRPNEERRVMAARIAFDAMGHPQKSVFFPGVIRSRARLTYEQVHQALELHEAGARAALGEQLPMLELARSLAEVLRRGRLERGSLDFDVPEARFVTDADNRVVDVRNRERFFSHRLIEEFMLAANEAVARFLTEKGLSFPYRVHPEPDPERLEALFRTLAATGLADVPQTAPASALKGLIEASRGTEREFLVSRLVLRSMMQARYAPELGPHFGLASPCYCHFTSPIRRYADLLVHRALKQALGMPGMPPLRGQKLLSACDQCNNRERAAQEAEREIARRLGCLLLRDRVGESFAGVIAGVTEFGFFVALKERPLEGMVRLDSLTDDWFTYDAARQELLGERTGRRLYLGQLVTVRLLEVNVGRLEITFELAASRDSAEKKGRRASGNRQNLRQHPSRRSGTVRGRSRRP